MITPISCCILGAPGLGKSTLAGSVMELDQVKKALLLVTKPGEEKSWLYQKYGLDKDAELYYDIDWNPTLGKYEAGAYLMLLKRLRGLLEDTEYDAVIIDPGTDAINLLEHHILAPRGVGSPGELSDTMGFYRQLRDSAQEFVMQAHLLSTPIAKKPKFVLIPWHTQPAKESTSEKVAPGVRKEKQSADQRAHGIEYEGNVLPMLEGSYRRKLMGDVDLVVVCHVDVTKDRRQNPPVEVANYHIRVVPNEEEHTKIRISPSLKISHLPNKMQALVEAMEEVK